MVKPVGGRGVKAPYETTHVRVPVPIKPKIQAMIEAFRENYQSDPGKPLTGLTIVDDLEDEVEEVEDEYEYPDAEIIKSQAEQIRNAAFEIPSLNRELDQLRNLLTSLEDALVVGRSLVKAKKSASQSMAKLLSEIYQAEVTVEDLR
jgi:DNA repair exonuclease SbcCD ATPase subunit